MHARMHTHTHNHFTALLDFVRDYLVSWHQKGKTTKVKPIWIYWSERYYSNTTVYYGIHERSKCIQVDSGITNLTHDHRSCVDFTLEVKTNVARCVHSSMNKPGVKRNSGL